MQVQNEHPRPQPWGLWATIGMSLAVMAVFVFVQFLAAIGYLIFKSPAGDDLVSPGRFDALLSDGDFLAITTILTAVICSSLVLLFARLKPGIGVSGYLALRPPGVRTLLVWLLIIAVAALSFDGLMAMLDKPQIPKFMIDSYRRTDFPVLFWLAIAVAAPVFEELFFRGFLYTGLAASRLGAAGAIIITAFVWAVIHIQYEAFLIGLIFIGGLVLGMARHRSRSLIVCVGMHMLFNLIALIQVALFVGSGS